MAKKSGARVSLGEIKVVKGNCLVPVVEPGWEPKEELTHDDVVQSLREIEIWLKELRTVVKKLKGRDAVKIPRTRTAARRNPK